MPFQTYGPFVVPTDIELKSDELARRFNEAALGLNEASGVYVFIDADRRMPVYVGKAYRNSFGARIAKHLNGARNSELRDFLDTRFDAQAGKIELLLLAQASEGGPLPRAETNGEAEHQAIDDLEKMMIRVLSLINPEICNIRR